MELFDEFDKTFLINLERRKDRLDSFDEQVKSLNLGEYERFDAVDGKKIDLSQYKTSLNSGQLGLILTVIDIIKICKEKNYKNVLILEDDCIFTEKNINYKNILSYFPSDWDMIYFGGNHNNHMGWEQPKEVNEKIIKLSNTFSTHFVVIKNTLFDHLLTILPKYKEPLDVTYVRLQKIFNVYCLKDGITTQKIDYSDIENRITDYTNIIK
jgi:GR25 family glycosyltransferase involved in LPS biosynthesis